MSCRPDFAVVVYPGHLWTPGTELTIRPDIRVRADSPPTFLLHAEDDPVDPVKHSLTYFAELQKAAVNDYARMITGAFLLIGDLGQMIGQTVPLGERPLVVQIVLVADAPGQYRRVILELANQRPKIGRCPFL